MARISNQRASAIEMAELLRVNVIQLRQWVEREGCPHNTDGTYCLRKVIAWRVDLAVHHEAAQWHRIINRVLT
jgi:hypothetical protein